MYPLIGQPCEMIDVLMQAACPWVADTRYRGDREPGVGCREVIESKLSVSKNIFKSKINSMLRCKFESDKMNKFVTYY